MTDLDAILRAVVADPADDTPRLVYADVLDGLAGVAACPACLGVGHTGPHTSKHVRDYGRRCDCCHGSGSVPNGMAERAEFVRVQCELARAPELVPANVLCHQVEWEHFAGRLSGLPGKVRFEPPAPGSSSGVGVLHYERRNPDREPLEKREQALFDRHKCEWFGGDRWAVLLLPDDDADLMPDLTAAVVRRGFVDELRCDLRTFVGGECERCGGDGLDAMADHHRATPCRQCHGTGRVGLDLAVVFARHPVRGVRPSDVEPWVDPADPDSPESHAWWRASAWAGREWEPGAEGNRLGNLPDKVFDAMATRYPDRVMIAGGPPSNQHIAFPGRETADRALSDTLVALGRAAAGFDPLT